MRSRFFRVYILLLFGALSAGSVYAQWTPISLPIENISLQDVQFLPNGEGYMAGWREAPEGDRSYILQSTDWGNTWKWMKTVEGKIMSIAKAGGDIVFAGLDEECACAIFHVYAPETDTFTSLERDPSLPGILSLQFFDASNGVAAGIQGTVVRTTDGGMSWERQPASTNDHFTRINFVDSMNGFALASSDQNHDVCTAIYSTTDGGTSWASSTTFDQGYNICDMHFFSESFGMIAIMTDFGCWVYETFDGGASWNTAHDFGGVFELNRFVRKDDRTFYLVGKYGSVLRSGSFGGEWEEVSIGTDEHVLGGYADSTMVLFFGENSMVRRAQLLGIDAPADLASFVGIYPQPVTDKSVIELRGATSGGTQQCRIYDNFGRLVSDMPLADGKGIIARNGLPSGVYAYLITENGRLLHSGRLLVQ